MVLTGEGADEVFVGYDIHREAKVRAFWARRPSDRRRSLLLTRLYPYLAQSPPDFLAGFYGVGLDGVDDDPFFAHRPRWNNGRKTLDLLPPGGAGAARRGRSGGAPAGVAAAGVRRLGSGGPLPVPGDDDLPVRLSSFFAGR